MVFGACLLFILIIFGINTARDYSGQMIFDLLDLIGRMPTELT